MQGHPLHSGRISALSDITPLSPQGITAVAREGQCGRGVRVAHPPENAYVAPSRRLRGEDPLEPVEVQLLRL